MRSRPPAAVAPVLVFVVALCAVAHGDTFTNPIVTRGADPWAFQWGGQYF